MKQYRLTVRKDLLFTRAAFLVHMLPLGGQVDGVLGMSFLRRFDLDLNFKQALVRIET